MSWLPHHLAGDATLAPQGLPAEYAQIGDTAGDLDAGPTLGGPDIVALMLLGLAVGVAAAGILFGISNVLLIPAGVLGAVAILLSPFIGLCVLFALLPMEGMTTVIPGAVTLLKLVAIGTAVSFLPRLLAQDVRRCFRSRTLRWMCILTLYSTLILPLSEGILAGMITIGMQLEMIGMALLFAAIPRTYRQFRFLCLFGALCAGLVGLYGAAMGGGMGEGDEIERLSLGYNPNGLAAALALCLFAAMVAWRGSGKLMRAVLVSISLLCLGAILMTGSRGVWLALLAAILLMPLLAPRVGFRTKTVAMGVVLLIGVLGACAVFFNVLGDRGEQVIARIQDYQGQSKGGRQNSRLDWIWPHYLAVVAKNPLIGGGPGKGFVDSLSPHNDYLWMAAEGGVPGLLLFLYFLFGVMLREARKNPDRLLRMVGVMLVIYVAACGLTHVTALSKVYAAAIGLLACMANLAADVPREQIPLASTAA